MSRWRSPRDPGDRSGQVGGSLGVDELMEGGEKGTEDGIQSRLRGQGRGLQGVGGRIRGVSAVFGNLEVAGALEGQVHAVAGAVACMGAWFLIRHRSPQILALLILQQAWDTKPVSGGTKLRPESAV